MPGGSYIKYADYYYCKKCKKPHQEYSKQGKEHSRFASNDHTKVLRYFHAKP